MIRNVTAAALVPFMKITGFRFSKGYRLGTSNFHKAVYRCVNTVRANHWAGRDKF